MKKTDIAMIILVASLSVLVAFFVANSIPALKVSEKPVKVKTIEPISEKTKAPDDRVFNPDGINPTVETYIGNE